VQHSIHGLKSSAAILKIQHLWQTPFGVSSAPFPSPLVRKPDSTKEIWRRQAKPRAFATSLNFPRWAAMAKTEMKRNPRYLWRGDRPRGEVRRLLGRARAMVLSSLSEGGANVISEAVAAGLPVLASRIDGSVGLLGRDYPGYFPVGDTAALARLLHRLETDPDFRARLRCATARRALLFRPAREKAAWQALIREIAAKSRPASAPERARQSPESRARNRRALTNV